MVIFKYNKQLSFFCLISVITMSSFNAEASECGVLKLQSNRSSGISVKSNKCSELPYVSMGAVFEMAPRGRLWLKSNATVHDNQGFQMICQNRTEQAIQLEFSGPLSPWLSLARLKNCSGWVNNKLSCDGNNGESQGVYCVSAELNPVSRNSTEQVQRSSSVKMRDKNQLANTNTRLNKQQLLESLKPEFKLCKQLNEVSQDIQVNWVVQMTKVKMFEVILPKLLNNNGLSECMKAVVTAISYPMFSRTENFNSIF